MCVLQGSTVYPGWRLVSGGYMEKVGCLKAAPVVWLPSQAQERVLKVRIVDSQCTPAW